ncbi:hypothetical protein WN943_013041 [Citrus x changshan-huyou]
MRGYIGATSSRHSQIDCRAALLFWYGIGDLTPAQQESDGFASFFTKYMGRKGSTRLLLSYKLVQLMDSPGPHESVGE